MGHVDGTGGAQTALRKLFEFIESEGYLVKVVIITDNHQRTNYLGDEVVLGEIPHSTLNFKTRLFKWLVLLHTSIRSRIFGPDIFITVGLSNSANFISRFLKKNCFTIGQDFIANRPIDDNLWKTSTDALDALAVQAPSMLHYLSKKFAYKSSINWLPCFPEDKTPGIFHTSQPVHNNQIRLAYFGRLAGNKGLHLLINSIPRIITNKIVMLDLWGLGDEENFLKELVIHLNLENKVRFMGRYPMGEPGAKLLVSYDSIVLCSTGSEGLPLILLESMAYGIPFMATDVGAIQDCCIDNPDVILVEPTQQGIDYGLRILCERLNDGSFDPMRLRDYYEAKFSHQVMSARWRECLNDPNFFFNE